MDLNAITGDLWIDHLGDQIEWIKVPKPGKPLRKGSYTVNGISCNAEDLVHSAIFHHQPFGLKLLKTYPRRDITVIRDGVCIQEGEQNDH